MKKKLLLFLCSVTMVLSLAACSSKSPENSGSAETAKKSDFPKRQIEMVIPFGAGGASDIFARQYSDIVKNYLGVPVTCINKSAAGTVEGMVYVNGLQADGYTILEITPSVLIKGVYGEFDFINNYEPLMKVENDLMAIGVSAKSEFKTLDELIAYAKENPGKLKIGGLSPGGLDDYTANGFASAAGIEWTYVPYTSGSEIKAAVLGGELDVYQDKLSSFLPLVESGDVRALVVLNDKEVDTPLLKGVPSSVEKGIDFTQGSWRGFAVKKGTPDDVKQILVDAFYKAYQDPAFAKMQEDTHTNLSVGYLSSEDFGKAWETESNDFKAVFEEMGLLK